MKNTECCPCCGNHCKKGEFKCNKGAMYFAQLELNEKIQEPKFVKSKAGEEKFKDIIHLIKKISHKIKKHKENISPEKTFSVLNDDEILQLYVTLKKIKENL